ncbi:MAG TPA: hypothetical protein GX702_13415 [Chloroflexi bacterium]|jgi:signal peptidase I|nr:hypothetical protein [Chloroflexota bacterium]
MSFIAKLAGLVAAPVWFLFLRPAALGGPASYIIVSGSSMRPTLEDGDLVVVRRQPTYAVGDVVAFRTDQGNVIHRIVGGSPEEGYLLQGDNRDYADEWRPRVEDVLGRRWLHLPSGGRALPSLRQPYFMAALTGGLALIVLDKPAQKTRRKAGRMVRRPNVDRSMALLSMEGLMGLAVVLGFLCLIFIGGAWYAYRQPEYGVSQVEREIYRHHGAFSYTVLMQPSDLYPDGAVGPFSASSGAADDGAEGAAPPAPFEGASASARVWVDFARINAEIGALEEALGDMLGSYSLTIVPTVSVRGRVGDHEVDETFSPEFGLELGSRLVTFDSELERTEGRSITESIARPGEITLGGYSVPVVTARRATVTGAVVCGVLALAIALALFYGPGRSEAGRIRLLHGSALVSVTHADIESSHQVEVSTI